jgi:hypothetical protein
MNYRNLRIAWSVGCGILCLLMFMLWARSHHYCDGLYLKCSKARCLVFGELHGDIAVSLHPNSMMPPNRIWWLAYGEIRPGLHFAPESKIVPIWSLIALVTVTAVAPWVPWRFSIRTLLIAITAIGLILGIFIISTR